MYKKIINPSEKSLPFSASQEDIIAEITRLKTEPDEEELFNLPKLNELFSPGYSGIIIEGSYKGKVYDGEFGKDLISILKEKTDLIFHDSKEIERGSKRKDHSFCTYNQTYVFKFNDLFLTITTFTPRSQNSVQYYINCNHEYEHP